MPTPNPRNCETLLLQQQRTDKHIASSHHTHLNKPVRMILKTCVETEAKEHPHSGGLDLLDATVSSSRMRLPENQATSRKRDSCYRKSIHHMPDGILPEASLPKILKYII